jgi:anti-sigma factor RsiW
MTDLWLEKELARQLAPVAAPDALWDRINQAPHRSPRRVSLDWVFRPVAAATLLLAFAGILRTFHGDRGPDKSVEQELAVLAAGSNANSRGFDFRSDSFDDMRAWVKAESNIDIDLPAGQPAGTRGAARLLGARLIRVEGLPVAAIDYRVGDEAATLFVSGKRAALSGNTVASKHLFSRTRSAGDMRLFSWNMRDQTYAIAFSGAGNAHAACMLCHSYIPG